MTGRRGMRARRRRQRRHARAMARWDLMFEQALSAVYYAQFDGTRGAHEFTREGVRAALPTSPLTPAEAGVAIRSAFDGIARPST